MDKGLPLWLRMSAVIGLVVAATLWITSSLHDIDTRLIAIEAGISDRWTSQHMTVWALRLGKDNAALAVPDVSRVIHDRSSNP